MALDVPNGRHRSLGSNKWAAFSLKAPILWSVVLADVGGKGTTRVTFISAYRVCDGAAESSVIGDSSFAAGMDVCLSGHTSVNLREQFVTDISILIHDFKIKVTTFS
jgi:hypothetical protein